MKRPKGWDELYLKAYKKEYSGKGYGSPERAMFEAGADAMLEGLKQQGVYGTYPQRTPKHKKGYLVFIPEEVE